MSRFPSDDSFAGVPFAPRHGDGRGESDAFGGEPRPVRRRRSRLWLHWLLFVLTTISVFIAGLAPGSIGAVGAQLLYVAGR